MTVDALPAGSTCMCACEELRHSTGVLFHSVPAGACRVLPLDQGVSGHAFQAAHVCFQRLLACSMRCLLHRH